MCKTATVVLLAASSERQAEVKVDSSRTDEQAEEKSAVSPPCILNINLLFVAKFRILVVKLVLATWRYQNLHLNGKMWHCISSSNCSRCWPIFIILLPTDLAVYAKTVLWRWRTSVNVPEDCSRWPEPQLWNFLRWVPSLFSARPDLRVLQNGVRPAQPRRFAIDVQKRVEMSARAVKLIRQGINRQ